MSPPLLGMEEERQSNISVGASSASLDSLSQTGSGLKERNYLGLSDCSSVGSSTVSSSAEGNKDGLNLRATELRLGLPRSQSPERDSELCLLSTAKLDEKQLFPLLPSKEGISSSSQKTMISGNKRGFSDTVDGFSEIKNVIFTKGNWMFNAKGADSETQQSVGQGKLPVNSGINVMLSTRPTPNSGVRAFSVNEYSGPQTAMAKQ